jgi:hypothetical protein
LFCFSSAASSLPASITTGISARARACVFVMG